MERKKRSKGRGWESCYVKKMYGTFGVEMRAYGQKLVKFCKHTDTQTHASKLVVEITHPGYRGQRTILRTACYLALALFRQSLFEIVLYSGETLLSSVMRVGCR